ncbi:replication factor C large subunit [Halalkaliarchaeum sp. AArc-GB]|uniref:replication factor C large subunit n=1 Tax=Halalkaliarchaeum sp. AArc-GB TaxID=3074078 RepID=UPI00286158EF|nr:replication factor C large subunit [Halalkaliarchaeum sp. AArc-GB]MDR5673153.1 replication factor C large subunit [Halalkaliarchaeum sp. AArc-GB]
MTDWTESYRPRTLSEVRGNDKAREKLREWAENWDDHREAVVLYGSPGVGKTSAAHALASDMGWKTVELNASDQRTADVIERFAGRAAKNATLAGSAAGGGARGGDTASRQLVILDEADNIHGNYDRGGARAITRLVKEASQPIVLIANDYYEMSRGLRNACREIEFRDVSPRSIVPVLRNICRQESVEFEPDALQRIAERNAGDLRGAVNDLQAIAEGRDRITLDMVVTGDRDRTIGIFPFLDAVLKEETPEEALRSGYDVDETPDDLSKWVEGNVLKAYDFDEAARAYEFLSNADVWLGRVRASQDYSYWRYVTDNVAAGVAASRDGTKGGWTRWGRPQFWRSSDATAEEVVRKLAAANGSSMATARREILPYLSAVTHHCKPRELTVAMAAAYEFEEKHVSVVTGSGESTNKVQSIVEDAESLREERMEDHAGGAFETRPNAGDAESDGERDGRGSTEGADESAGSGGENATLDELSTANEPDDATEGNENGDGENAAVENTDDEDDGQLSFGDFT